MHREASVLAVEFQEERLAINVIGTPTDCIDKAREVGQILYDGVGPWHFTSLSFDKPNAELDGVVLHKEGAIVEDFRTWVLRAVCESDRKTMATMTERIGGL